MWKDKLQACDYLEDLNFQKLYGSDVGPDLGNASESQKLIWDICFAVSMVSSYLVEPHWIGAKNLLRYLRGTITHGLRSTAGNVRLLGYTNVDWAGNVEDRKSTSGCCFSLGSASISWMSKK